MKKSLLAVALLGSFAGASLAAPSVTLYGAVDTGIVYTHTHKDGASSTDKVEMKSGYSYGDRWGLKGTEDIGAAKVGFVLESGFLGDDGTNQDSRLFAREASLHVSSAYGTVYAGRLFSIMSTGGSQNRLGGVVAAFGNSYGLASQKGSTAMSYGKRDNMLGYASPKFGGFDFSAEYSMKADSTKETGADENKAGATRYAAAALRYQAANFGAVLGGDYSMWGNDTTKADDGYNIVLGGNYNFGPVRMYAMANYFDNVASGYDDTFGLIKGKDAKAAVITGYGAEISAKIPLCGGDLMPLVGYRHAKDVDNGANKFERWNAGVVYTYAFSKRTYAYGTVAYAQEKAKATDTTDNQTQVAAGLVHKF